MSASAIGPGDAIYAASSTFARRVAQARRVLQEAAQIGGMAVSFSGGKDSLVLLDLARQLQPDVSAVLFNSGCELDETIALAVHYGVTILRPRLTAVEMARYAGWWGYEHPIDPGCPFRLKAVIIDEPSETFVVSRGLRVMCMGLRGEESAGRRMNRRAHGMLYQGADRTWYCCPLGDWTTDDVWAYIASRELRYHRAYDVMAEMGIDRARARLGMQLGAKSEATGNFALLRRLEPATFARLAAEFPAIRRSA